MKINSRQICFIMLTYTVVSRLLLYATELSEVCGNDLLFPILIDFAVQTVVVWAVCYLCSRTDKTFFGLLSDTFGNVFARIIYGLFALYFAFSAVFPMMEQKQFVGQVFYDTVPSLLAFLPFFIFSVYAGCKELKNIGRCADIALPIFVTMFALIIFMAFSEVDLTNLLPVLKRPATNILSGALGSFFRFTEPSFLLMFMGHFRYRKGDAAKITLSYAGGGLTVILFAAVFYSIYGVISPSRDFAIAKVALFFPAIELIGRVDLIALYFMEIAMLFALVINIQFSVHCLKKCTGLNTGGVWSLTVNAVLLALVIVLDSSFSGLIAFYSKWVWIVTAVFALILPLLAWTLKKGEKNETH